MSEGAFTTLVYDHDAAPRGALVARLTAAGQRAIAARDAEHARACLAANAAALLVIALPPGLTNGATGLRALAAEAGARHVPVLAIVTPADLDDAVALLDGHADDWLLAPVHPTLLAARIATFQREAELRARASLQQRHAEALQRHADSLRKSVIPVGVTLLATRDFAQLLEMILVEAKTLCHADGGTLYLRTDDDRLRFVIMRNDSLGIAMGGTSGAEPTFAPLPLRDPATGEPNHHNVATHVALTGAPVNIADAYHADGFEFSGAIAFDRRTGYRSRSFLTVPLRNAAGRVIGVLQLVNALAPAGGTVTTFDPGVEPVVEALCSLAAAALEVYVREDGLRRQISDLHVQIDEAKRMRAVTEIADTDYFRDLQRRARELKGT